MRVSIKNSIALQAERYSQSNNLPIGLGMSGRHDVRDVIAQAIQQYINDNMTDMKIKDGLVSITLIVRNDEVKHER